MRLPTDRTRTIVMIVLTAFCATRLPAQEPGTRSAPTRAAAPSASEMAAAARAGTLDAANTVTSTILGKQFKFTAAGKSQVPTATGTAVRFVGVLENGAAGDETGLPPGRYNLTLVQVNGQWKGYAESGGSFVGNAIRASYGPASTASTKPAFHEKGWCISGMYSEKTTIVGRDGYSYKAYPWKICF
jgi:hypothetical protein